MDFDTKITLIWGCSMLIVAFVNQYRVFQLKRKLDRLESMRKCEIDQKDAEIRDLIEQINRERMH